jgi:hypothetical protein
MQPREKSNVIFLFSNVIVRIVCFVFVLKANRVEKFPTPNVNKKIESQ